MLHQIPWGGLAMVTLLIVSLPADSLPPLAVPPIAPTFIAQGTVSSGDLQKFANVIKKLRTIEQEINPKANKVVANSGISQARFKAIVLSKKDPSTKLSPPLTADEQQKFAQATKALKPIANEFQAKSKKALSDAGLTLQQFQSIRNTVQQDPKLQEKLRSLLKK